MNNPDSVKIIERFFHVFELLIANNELRGIKTFTDKYDINRRNFYHSMSDHTRDIFQMAWLTYLIEDFGVSSQWLMTGKGEIFVKDKFPKKD